MSYHDEIRGGFTQAMRDFNHSRGIGFLGSGRLAVAHYKSLLIEIFHYAREDPQLQALATVYFRGIDRDCVKMFLKHAISEIGHEAMALQDLKTLGADVSLIKTSNPLPATAALTAYPFYQVQYRSAVGYLGYLYFLEHMPTNQGSRYTDALQSAGVPRDALTFLGEHMSVDIAHNKLMEIYVEKLVRTPVDVAEVIYAMRVTAHLYAEMIWAAFARADNPTDFGLNHFEMARN